MIRIFNRVSRTFSVALLLTIAANAATISGNVTNATSNKPSAGDDVVLLQLASGMQEVARTTTDAKGHFKLEAPAGESAYMVRVTHQKVSYFERIPPGLTAIDVKVYDSTSKDLSMDISDYVFLLRAGNGAAEFQEEWGICNGTMQDDGSCALSKTPQTYNPDQTFKVQLPPDAQVDGGAVIRPNSPPLTTSPAPGGKPGSFYFAYPIRPGATTFSITYHMPYSGKMSITPQPQYKFREFGIAVPASVSFKSDSQLYKKTKQSAGVTGALALDVKPGDSLAYEISGSGELPRQGSDSGAGGGGDSTQAGPGGGIGNPEGTPDPLKQFRWWILGGLALVLAAGGVYVYMRPSKNPPSSTGDAQTAAAAPPSTPQLQRAPVSPAGTTRSAGARAGVLMEAIKNELFTLEMDLHQGAISQEDYDRAKAALNLLIARELKRSGSAGSRTAGA